MKITLMVLISAIAFSACGGGDAAPATYKVEYVITGSVPGSAALLNYDTDTDGLVEQFAILPKTISFAAFPSGGGLYLNAKNVTNIGAITVTIRINGDVYKTATTSEASGSATASGKCCSQ